MQKKQARLITINDHPQDVEVFKAENAYDALVKASEILSNGGARKKAAIWEPEDGQLDQAVYHTLSDVYNQIAEAGYEAYDRAFAPFGKVTRHKAGDNVSDQLFDNGSPLLLQVVSAVKRFKDASLLRAISTAKDVAIDINPHFDKAKISVPSHASPKNMTRLKDLYNKTLFSPKSQIRMIWNEKAGAGNDERLGTLLWFDEDAPQLQMDAEYRHLIAHGNMEIAANYARENLNLTLENARQVPNKSVLFFDFPEDLTPSDIILHSIMPKDKTGIAEHEWNMHAVDVQYTPPPKYPWLPLKPLA